MSPIPHAIHQTWQTKDYLKWPTQLQVWMTSWTSQTTWTHHLYDDSDCLAVIQAYHPQLVDIYQALPTGAERADLFRYVILHAQGGVWADLDTTCIETLDTWPIDGCSLLLGMHGTVTGPGHQKAVGFMRPAQVSQWIMAAVPKHPVLAAVIREVEVRVRAELTQSKKLSVTAEAIFNRTGGGVWTDCVLSSLKLPDAATHWEYVLTEPFEQGETRILPMRAFGWDKTMRRMPRSQTYDRVLVRHHGMGSWKPTTNP